MKARFLTLLFLFATVPLRAADRWYVFSMGGTPVGHVAEVVDGGTTKTTVVAKLVRLGSSVEMKFETTAVETAAGDLEKLTFETVLSKQPTRFEATVEGDRIRIATPPHERFVERGSERILGPRAIVRGTAKLSTKGDAVEYATFAPDLQRVVRMRRIVVATKDEICGVRGTKIEETIEGVPTRRTLWVDEHGVTIGDAMPGPVGQMTTCRAPREVALAANGELPADLYERSLAHSNVRVADAPSIDRAVVRVVPRDPAQTLPSFATHNQRMLDASTIEIRRSGGAGVASKELLEPNALVESSHESIVKAAREIAPDAKPAELAEQLTAWVSRTVTMDTGIVMAPASELIRDRKGTCIGFATLLASLARARGIPARIAMGYVYIGGIWGGHAWTEMLIDDRWRPYDAALYAPGGANAARIAVGASSFADGGGDLNAKLGLLFGQVDFEFVEYESGGRTTRVPPGQKMWRTEGSRYINPGLGIDVDMPGWTIERADSTWPSSLVVAFRRGDSLIEMHEKRADSNR